jgi:hypothetical protein
MRNVSMLAVALLSCSTLEKASSAVSPQGKPMAPVSATAEWSQQNGVLRIAFEAPAKKVSVVVTGVDGLMVATDKVAQLNKAQKDEFALGEIKVVPIVFSQDNPKGVLAVNVTGIFNGAQQVRVMTFEVGHPEPQRAPGRLMTDSTGETLKVKDVQ